MEPGVRVSLNRVRKEYAGGIKAVEALDLEIAAGDFVALLGPSGCGKSTLLKLIAGLERPSTGEVVVGSGGDRRAAVAFVFQDANLLPWRTVLDNVALPLELLGVPLERRLADARASLAEVGLSDFERAYPEQLSGGMKMRVSIARALVTRPKLLLMDEPFGALDEITREHLDDQLRALWLREKLTIVFVTHSVTEATLLADRTVVFSPRPARVVLDRRVSLPPERGDAVRLSPELARQAREVHEALRS